MKPNKLKKIYDAKLFWALFVCLSLSSSYYLFSQSAGASNSTSVLVDSGKVKVENVEITEDYRTRDFNIYNNVIGFIRQLLY